MTANLAQLPIPPFFDPANAGKWHYRPDQQTLFERADEWRREHHVQPASADEFGLHLLLIDEQKDFCFPEGTLYVGGRSGTGAIEDSRRTAEFIYRNLGSITQITATMDTHFAYQIFFPAFWIDGDDRALVPHTIITTAEIQSGKLKPNPMVASWLCAGDYGWLLQQVEYYCRELEREGKYSLYLWPPHCILGSDGHSLVGVIHEARMFHSFVRGAQSWVEVKGDNFLTENYSVLRPEVLLRHDGQALAQKNARLLQTLLTADAVVIAGQAASHCVKSTVDDLLGEMMQEDSALAKKVYIMADCMSAVTVPDGKGGFIADFTSAAEEALERYASAGMHVVRSTDPLESWPGIEVER